MSIKDLARRREIQVLFLFGAAVFAGYYFYVKAQKAKKSADTVFK